MKKFKRIEEDLFENIVKLREEVINNVILKEDNYFNLKMSGFCANMSFLIFNYLKSHGENPLFVVNDNHCFILLEENILDLTATQFLVKRGGYYDKVHVDFRSDNGAWAEKCILDSNDQIEKYFATSNWPDEQKPFFLIEKSKWYKCMIEDMVEFQNVI